MEKRLNKLILVTSISGGAWRHQLYLAWQPSSAIPYKRIGYAWRSTSMAYINSARLAIVKNQARQQYKLWRMPTVIPANRR